MTRRTATILIAALGLCALIHSPLWAGEPERLSAALLTRDLGDPRTPGNLKLVLTLPEALAHRTAMARSGDFSVYVYRAGQVVNELRPENKADGVYLWRSGDRLFLDVRQVPLQDREGEAVVRVAYHPNGGPVLAQGIADGRASYATELVDVILAVDISSSMNYTDPRRRRVTAAQAFIEMAREGGGIGRIGLVTFNSHARLITPLLPLARGEELLKALSRIGANGLTSLDAPLEMGMEELARDGGSTRPVIILMTDGRNEGSRYRNTHLECAKNGVRVYTIGLTERADHDLLKAMADATGGLYFRAPTDDDLPEVYARLAAELGRRRLLRAEVLRTPVGDTRLPVDATIRQLAAIADGGAKLTVARPGEQGERAGGRLSSVHLLRPDRGLWRFGWTDAVPDLSVLALSGDTQMYLDVFPPQLRGERLAVGATLAMGVRPLASARVWAEPVPGIIDRRFELFDDGQNGDGDAGDGVYGAVITVPPNAPDRFDLVFRADGSAWDQGDFVRQTSGIVLRLPDPPPDGSASLDGDLDFGVLFPGETGTAIARVSLESRYPRELYFDLAWNKSTYEWPDLSSSVLVQPGRRAFELEITVPDNAKPGEYTGSFAISDRGDLGDSSSATVRVGTVHFDNPAGIDLGIIPPGTFVSRRIALAYDADKGAALSVEAEGDDAVVVTTPLNAVAAGKGDIPLETRVSVPLGKHEGAYQGRLLLRAGPGRAEIPLRWQVRPYAAARSQERPPPPGLPRVPELPGADGSAPTALRPPLPDDGTFHDGPLGLPPSAYSSSTDTIEGQSPLAKAARIFTEQPGPTLLPPPGGMAEVAFPVIGEENRDAGRESFWSAWWMYLLALLLLLLLLLLLIVYILYRLGKSQLARFLLVSGLANLVLLTLFIALLGTADTVTPASAPKLSVTLVEDSYEPPAGLTEMEMGMLAASGSGSVPGSGMAAAGEISLPASRLESGPLVVRSVEMPDAAQGEMALADASRPSAMPLELESAEPVRRRVRRPERQAMPQPELELPEMTEPPMDTGGQKGERSELGERRLDMEHPDSSDRPVWSGGDRTMQPSMPSEELVATEISGLETVRHDPTARRIDPRGRRRTARQTPETEPEPQVEMMDPVRNESEKTAPDAPERREDDPGVEEIRLAQPTLASDRDVEKPGAVLLAEASPLKTEPPSLRGLPGEDSPQPARPRGGQRSARGGAVRSGSPTAGPESVMPGGAPAAPETATRSADGFGMARGGGAVGEQRFDSEPGQPGGAADGTPDATGRSRSTAVVDGGGSDVTPSPLGGNGPAERLAFAGGAPEGMAGRREQGGPRAGDRRDGRNRGGGGADGGPSVPDSPGGGLPGIGGGGDTPGQGVDGGRDGPGGDGNGSTGLGRGSGTGAIGEGRFDDVGATSGGAGLAQRTGAGLSGDVGRSRLDDGGIGTGLDSIPLASLDSGMRRNERRDRRRSVSVASSSLEMDSLLIVVGDFSRLPDSASENLFAALSGRLGAGLTVEERRLAPDDDNLSDCLLAVLSPDEAKKWTGHDLEEAGAYLKNGGHIWLDGRDRSEVEPLMRRLADAAGGEYSQLPASHQLAEFDAVDAVTVGGTIAAVSTTQDWRAAWRYGDGGNGALRFLIRGLNYFLSGNAETGIVLEQDEVAGGLRVEPYSDRIPDQLAGARGQTGRPWGDFGPDGADSWRMPAWSDPGRISAISDGQGGRALKVDVGAAARGRAALYRTLNPPEDFTSVRSLSLDVYYDGDGEAALSIVFTVRDSAGGWQDYETLPLTLENGWNRLSYPVAEGEFRALANGGAYTRALPGAARTGRVGFFQYRTGATPTVTLFRDIRLHEE